MTTGAVSSSSSAAAKPLASGYINCRLCKSRLFFNRTVGNHKDDPASGICAECHNRPEAKHLIAAGAGNGSIGTAIRVAQSPVMTPASQPPAAPRVPRPFNAAEKSLIRSVHSYMPAEQVLDILNTRLIADVGAAAVPFTAQQLQAEVEKLVESSAGEGEWASLRRMLARARTAGLLGTITLQAVDDFSVVFGLSSAQHMRLRDVIRNAQEER